MTSQAWKCISTHLKKNIIFQKEGSPDNNIKNAWLILKLQSSIIFQLFSSSEANEAKRKYKNQRWTSSCETLLGGQNIFGNYHMSKKKGESKPVVWKQQENCDSSVLSDLHWNNLTEFSTQESTVGENTARRYHVWTRC